MEQIITVKRDKDPWARAAASALSCRSWAYCGSGCGAETSAERAKKVAAIINMGEEVRKEKVVVVTRPHLSTSEEDAVA